MLDVPGRTASTSQWLRHFHPQAETWLPVPGAKFWGELLSQSVCIARGSVCQVPAGWGWGNPSLLGPDSLHAQVFSLAQLQLPGQGQGWWPRLSCSLTGHDLQVSGIICRDFLPLRCVQGSESLLFGNSQAQS